MGKSNNDIDVIESDDYGEKCFPDKTSFEEGFKEIWGNKWSVFFEAGKLQAVLLRRPGKEIEDMDNPVKWRWKAPMDPKKARMQHDKLAEIYRKHGVKVYYVEDQREDRPNSIYMCDHILGTPQGVILSRLALRVRRGEERAVAATLGKIGVPIIRTISGRGIFEGSCGMWIDRETIILGSGVRANREGIRQVEEILTNMGVKTILPFQIPYGHAHIDGLINIVDRKKALIFPWQTPYDIVEALKERNFTIIEAPSIKEVKEGYAINLVTLEPGKVLVPVGNEKTKKVLKKNGIKVIEVDVSELLKGNGSLHCLTAVLAREEI